MRRTLAKFFGVTLLLASAVAAPVVAQATEDNGFPRVAQGNPFKMWDGIIALSNCSASLVRFPSSQFTDKAMMLTNGHCTGDGVPPNEIFWNKKVNKTGTLLKGDTPTEAGKLKFDLVLYATESKTDSGLYRSTQTYEEIYKQYQVFPRLIAPQQAQPPVKISIPSGYWKQNWDCMYQSTVHKLVEDKWTWEQSIKYNMPCETKHGSSGSPIIDPATGDQIGINNTGNDDGKECTMNNPCEVDENGKKFWKKGQSYGQQTWWFTTCVDESTNQLNLQKQGCLLPKGR